MQSTVGVKPTYKGLPKAARNYLQRIEELCAVAGRPDFHRRPKRDETIVLRHPFDLA